MAGRRAGHSPRDVTPRPRTPEVHRPPWTVVLRPCPLEVVQHLLRAISRPHREQVMIVVLETAAASHGDEPSIPTFIWSVGPPSTGNRDDDQEPSPTSQSATGSWRRRPWLVKLDGPCARCGRLLVKDTSAVWNNAKRKMYCLTCADA